MKRYYNRTFKSNREDYIAVIYRLHEVYGSAKLSDISRELGVKPATTSKVLSQLEKSGLVKKYKYRKVVLTEMGEKIAVRIIRKHRISEVFLAHKLSVDIFDTHYYAHYLEHLPDELIERIYILLGFPQKCPHGNIIPDAERDKDMMLAEYIRLSEATRGTYRVERIAGELSSILPVLKELQLKPNTIIEVLAQTPEYTVIKQNSMLRNVAKHIAFTVLLTKI